MRHLFIHCRCLIAGVMVGSAAVSAFAGGLQPVTVLSSASSPASGGNGDSTAMVVSADGRFVAFASAANNLTSNSTGYPLLVPPKLNVFLRDRLNQTTTLVSINAGATGGGSDDSIPTAISTNGQFVLFESVATNLAMGVTNNVNNVYVRDVVNGATFLASIGLNGAAANAGSRNSVMTPDGRYVAFSSDATNLVAGDTNGIADVFVRDLQMGVTVLASIGAAANSIPAPSAAASDQPAISSDGRYVAFYSTAADLVAGVQTVGAIYLRDLIGGQITEVSAAAPTLVQPFLGTPTVFSCCPAISTNGQFVAYETCQTNSGISRSAHGVILAFNTQSGSTVIVSTNALPVAFGAERGFRGFDMTPDGQSIALTAGLGGGTYISSGSNAIQVWNAQTGAITTASVDLNGFSPTTGISDQPLLDSSGRYVSFMADATNLTSNNIVGGFHLYVRDLQAGVTTLIDSDPTGAGSTTNLIPSWSFSADGSVIAFAARDTALLPNDSNHAYDVFARNLASNSMELISLRQSSQPSATTDEPASLTNSSVSADGRFVAFASQADDLIPGYSDGVEQVFVRDSTEGSYTLVSVDTNGVLAADGASMGASISSDGRYVLFTSDASDLAPGDTNDVSDVFVRDLQMGTTVLVSVNTNGTGAGNGPSYAPMMSTNGRYVLFHTLATDLTPGLFATSSERLLWRDLQAGITLSVSFPSNFIDTYNAVMTPDGQNVAWTSTRTLQSMTYPLYLWNAQAVTNLYTNTALSGPLIAAISPDGSRVAAYASAFYVVSFTGLTNLMLPSSTTARPQAQFSSDGNCLAYTFATGTGGHDQIYLYNFQTGTNLLVSASFNGQAAANANADNPAISPDGRFVAYQSTASNLTPAGNNGWPDVYLFDQLTGTTTLVTASQFGGPANGPSQTPLFSGDSQTLFLQSWASDFPGGFFSSSGEIWALSLYSTNLPPPFSVTVGPAFATGQAALFWQVAPGKFYQAQFKNELSDPVWQPLTSGLTIVGSQGYFVDPAPPTSHRFYRIVSF